MHVRNRCAGASARSQRFGVPESPEVSPPRVSRPRRAPQGHWPRTNAGAWRPGRTSCCSRSPSAIATPYNNSGSRAHAAVGDPQSVQCQTHLLKQELARASEASVRTSLLPRRDRLNTTQHLDSRVSSSGRDNRGEQQLHSHPESGQWRLYVRDLRARACVDGLCTTRREAVQPSRLHTVAPCTRLPEAHEGWTVCGPPSWPGARTAARGR